MKIVITGALGHIGSYLIRELTTVFSNDKFLLIDNLSTQRYCSLFNLPKNCSFIEIDVSKEISSSIFQNADHVIHLAAMTDAAGSFDRAKLVEENNFEATRCVAQECVRVGASLIHFSSTSVYGTQEEKVDENCSKNNLKPQSPYAETKLKEEEWLKKQEFENKLKFVTLRLGTIAGVSTGMRFHTAVNKFSWQASMGLPITVWKTALNQKRPYLDILDAMKVIKLVIDKNIYDGSIYNVVTENMTVNDIVQIIQMRIKDLEIEFVDSKIMNQLSYEVLSNKIKSLGFRSSGSIKNAINETLDTLGYRKP